MSLPAPLENATTSAVCLGSCGRVDGLDAHGFCGACAASATGVHAVIECNADLDHPCDADDGESCPSCRAEVAAMRAEYEATRPMRRADYAEALEDAGRGHLLSEADRSGKGWV